MDVVEEVHSSTLDRLNRQCIRMLRRKRFTFILTFCLLNFSNMLFIYVEEKSKQLISIVISILIETFDICISVI